MDMKIVFMGSPDFALPTLQALAREYRLVGVVTQPDKPAGRGGSLRPPAVKRLAVELGLPVIQPLKLRLPETMEQLRLWQPDLIVIAAFGKILRPELLNLPTFGCLGVHASLLPRWRGAAPIQAMLLNGDETGGVSIMKMDPGEDTGPILSQRSLSILPEDTAGSLSPRLARLGADLLIETMPDYLKGKLTPQPQDDERVTRAPMLKKEDGLLDFNRTVLVLERQVRAFNPWPGAYSIWQGQPLKVLRAHIILASNVLPGGAYIQNGFPAWGAADGLLILDEIQPAGKKAMLGSEFLRGARTWGKT